MADSPTPSRCMLVDLSCWDGSYEDCKTGLMHNARSEEFEFP